MQAATGAGGAAGQIRSNRRKPTQPHRSCLDSALVSGNADKPSQPAHTRQLKRVAAPEQQAEAGLALAGAAGYADAGPAAFMPSFLHHEMPAQQHLPAGDATLAEYTEAAPVGQAKPRRKRASKATKSQDGFDSCSFCSTTESPLWRNGPAQYPRLCNACGIRYTRHVTGKTGPRTNPFSAKILASLHKKAAKAAARAAQACLYQHTAEPFYAAPATMGSTYSPAAAADPWGAYAVPAAAGPWGASAVPAAAVPASGKRVREASALQEGSTQQAAAALREASGQQEHQWAQADPWGACTVPAAAAAAPWGASTVPSAAVPASGKRVREASALQEGSSQQAAAALREASGQQEQQWAQSDPWGAYTVPAAAAAAAAPWGASTVPSAAVPASGKPVREASAQQEGSAQQAAAAQHEASAQQEQQWAQGLVMQSLVAGQSAGQEWGLQEQEASTQADSDHERSSKKAKQSSSSDTNNNQQSLAEQPAVYAAAAPVPALAASQGLTHAMLQQMAVLLQALPAEELHGLQELLYQQQPSFHQQVQQQLQTAGMVTAGSSLGASGPAGEQEGQRGSRSTSTAVVKEYSTTSLDSAMTGDLSDGVKTEF